MSQIYDITIIGGGPVGLYAAFYAGMRQAKTKIIESLDLLGGQPAHLYPEKAIYDIPAHYQIKGGDLTQSLIQQLDHFDTTICTGASRCIPPACKPCWMTRTRRWPPACPKALLPLLLL